MSAPAWSIRQSGLFSHNGHTFIVRGKPTIPSRGILALRVDSEAPQFELVAPKQLVVRVDPPQQNVESVP